MNEIIRIIPRLDLKGPNIVKGIQFEGYRVLGTAEYFAEKYYEEGADELFLQDTVASLYQRPLDFEVIKKTAKRAFIPLTVAGGIRTLEDIKQALRSGADKVAVNTAAIADPMLIKEASYRFGAQCIVVSMEVFRQKNGALELWTNYGRERTQVNPLAWAKKCYELGAGEILLNSINHDGMGAGYDIDLIQSIASSLPIPVIASCGIGKKEDFLPLLKTGLTNAISAASLFHYYYTPTIHQRELEDRYRLRNGMSLDTGNIDFILHGYGGIKEIPVHSCSIGDVKKFLTDSGYRVRKLS